MKKVKAQIKMICPFDSTHQVNETRFNTHLLKCKSPNKDEFRMCKYYNRHWVQHKYIEEHELDCQYRNQAAQKEENSFNDFSDLLLQDDNEDTWKNLSNIEKIRIDLGNQSKRKGKKAESETNSFGNKYLKGSRTEKESYSQPEKWVQPDFKSWYHQVYLPRNSKSSLRQFTIKELI